MSTSGKGSEGAVSKESNSGEAKGEKPSIEPTAKPVGINQETVRWYARQIGLKYENSSQYDTAEKLLKERLRGGYWKIIAQGEPLTEEAGNCQQEYCLVRGVDACTVCRDRDMVLRGSSLFEKFKRKCNSASCHSIETEPASGKRARAAEKLCEHVPGLDPADARPLGSVDEEMEKKLEWIPPDLLAAIILALATLVFTLTPLN